ncbi:outer membrane protein assembly factor BamE [Trinickia fusca]|nr:outer membrane protein assembly factor BamE [Trinickia fusca]
MAVTAVALVAGCSTYDNVTQRVAQSITPYRITVVQGNFVSKEAAEKMRVGMSRPEVRAVLGTPLLTDMFHADRWDYLFYFKRGSTAVVQQRDFIVNFQNDRVVSWTGGDDLPSELELLADIDGDKLGKKAKAKALASASAASASAASAASATAAAAPVAASEAPAPAVDANAQAAEAANRATNQVSTSTQSTPSVRSRAPTAGGTPPSATPQLKFHRQPQPPAVPNDSNPVGPAGTESRDGSAAQSQRLSSSQDGSSTGS